MPRKNSFLILILIFSSSLASFANAASADCSYVDKSAEVEWTAFKTQKKVGVKGLLKDVEVTIPKRKAKAKDLKSLLPETELVISGAKGSVDSNNSLRDNKIAKFFFGNLAAGPKIMAKILSVEKDKMQVKLTMNKKSRVFPFSYTAKGGMFVANSKIDILKDFSANKAFEGISKACELLHEKKTWTDVLVKISAKYKGC